MPHFDFLIRQGLAVLSHPKNPRLLIEEEVDIGITNGCIAEIGSLTSSSADQTFKAKGLRILPGLIDTQVHFREPGGEHKEDIASGSRSGLLGGITAFLEMPNTEPPTLTAQALEEKIQRAEKRSWCDFAFFMGSAPENIPHLPQLEKQKGCCGIKIFMGPSTGSLLVDKTEHLEQILQSTSGPIAIHSEDATRLQQRKTQITSSSTVQDHPIWRDPQSALLSTQRIVELAQKHHRRIHILHVSTEEEMLFLAEKKDTASVEVTPQHLSLMAPDCYDRLGSFAQMNPPIRDQRHQQALWKALQSGVVTMLGSDHAPHTREEKAKPYPYSPSGMPGTQTMLPIMLNHVNQSQLSLKKLVELLALNPHYHYKINKQGLIHKGFKAHFTIVDLKKTKKITRQWLASKCGWSPFENQTVVGWPVGVLLKGNWAMREDEVLGPPKGELLSFSR